MRSYVTQLVHTAAVLRRTFLYMDHVTCLNSHLIMIAVKENCTDSPTRSTAFEASLIVTLKGKSQLEIIKVFNVSPWYNIEIYNSIKIRNIEIAIRIVWSLCHGVPSSLDLYWIKMKLIGYWLHIIYYLRWLYTVVYNIPHDNIWKILPYILVIIL